MAGICFGASVWLCGGAPQLPASTIPEYLPRTGNPANVGVHGLFLPQGMRQVVCSKEAPPACRASPNFGWFYSGGIAVAIHKVSKNTLCRQLTTPSKTLIKALASSAVLPHLPSTNCPPKTSVQSSHGVPQGIFDICWYISHHWPPPSPPPSQNFLPNLAPYGACFHLHHVQQPATRTCLPIIITVLVKGRLLRHVNTICLQAEI